MPISIDAAVTTVRRFLAAFEARRLDEANACLAADACMVFPGGRSFTALGQIVARSEGRYARVAKRFERVDGFLREDGRVVVYCIGVLHGRWKDGAPFDGIRFLDRFEVDAAGIRLQEVWNDACEARLAHGDPPAAERV